MKVIINGKSFAKKYKTGVQRYFIEIIKQIDEIAKDVDIELIIPKYIQKEFDFKNIKVIRFGKLKPNLWEQIELPIYVMRKKGLLINLCNTSPLLNPGIVCIHDINCLVNKKYYPKPFWIWYGIMFRNAVKRAKKIITVSNFSRNEIERYYKINDVEVISNSYEHILKIKEDGNILKRINIENIEYIFCLGTIQKNKNINWILENAKINKNYTYVITGYKNQKIEFNQENVIYTGYLKDEEIKTLMVNAKAYILPSFYEGFGLPAIEALALGTKVIVSDIEVMHEILEKSVYYINPRDSNVIIDEILERKIEEKEKILQKYNWKKSAIKLLKIIENEKY